MDTRGKKGFIHIDIAQSGNTPLVEQKGFNGPLSLQDVLKGLYIDTQGLRAQGSQPGTFHSRVGMIRIKVLQEPEASETPHVHKVDLDTPGESHYQMRMFMYLGSGGSRYILQKELARHPQLKYQGISSRRRYKQPFGPACYEPEHRLT